MKELHETLSSASVLMTATDSPRYRHLDISEEVTKTSALQSFSAYNVPSIVYAANLFDKAYSLRESNPSF